ncbi:MAG: hypothetical protein E7242_01325 [Lachnospiraceae bacterium]|nr:hypothetical protein [Lachnospiraceae bacterium]
MRKIAVCLIALMSMLFAVGCSKSSIEGTYTLTKIEKDGSTFTVEEMKALGEDSFEGIYVILKDGGSAYYFEAGKGELTTWEKTSDGVKIGLMECTLKDGNIIVDLYGATAYFEKTSDSQTIPSSDSEIKETEEKTTQETSKETTKQVDYTGATIPTNNSIDGNIEIVKEYFEINNFSVSRYLVIKNISSMNISVNSNTATYDSSGNLSGAETGNIDALAPNDVGLLMESYDKEGEIASITSTISSKELSKGTKPLSDFTYDQSIVGQKVVLQCQYNGTFESFDVIFNVLFFKDGEVVGTSWDMENFSKGVPTTIQIESWDEFDSAEVYPSGYEWV